MLKPLDEGHQSDIRDLSLAGFPDFALMSFVKWFEREVSPPCDFSLEWWR